MSDSDLVVVPSSNGSTPSPPLPPPPPPLPHKSQPKRALEKSDEDEEFCAEPAAKRTCNEIVDGIEPKRESLDKTEHAVTVEAETNDESSAANAVKDIEETNLSLGNVESDARLTICLNCGLHCSGTHANISYCFSEHMCESKEKEKQYLNAICVIANAMYTNIICLDSDSKQATSTPNSSMNQPSTSDFVSNHDISAIASTISNSDQPFNPSNVGRAFKDLLE